MTVTKKHMRKETQQKRTALVREAERIFAQPQAQTPIYVVPEFEFQPYAGELRVVQSVTTYSACEEPFPNPRKMK